MSGSVMSTSASVCASVNALALASAYLSASRRYFGAALCSCLLWVQDFVLS
jgi:hypothetical protein